MSKTNPTLTEVLLAALVAQLNIVSMRKIGRESGVPQPVLSRFIRGRQSLRLPYAEALCAYLGIRHVVEPTRKRRSAGGQE
jgi:hypothetical protein